MSTRRSRQHLNRTREPDGLARPTVAGRARRLLLITQGAMFDAVLSAIGELVSHAFERPLATFKLNNLRTVSKTTFSQLAVPDDAAIDAAPYLKVAVQGEAGMLDALTTEPARAEEAGKILDKVNRARSHRRTAGPCRKRP